MKLSYEGCLQFCNCEDPERQKKKKLITIKNYQISASN